MYFGDNSSRGVAHAINEIVSNSIDLFLAGSASRIGVSFEGETITCSDDGPGLPYDVEGPGGASLAEHYLTSLHDTRTADGHAPHVHLRGNGWGMMCVNAASEFFEVETLRWGRLWTQEFRRGSPISSPASRASEDGKGTSISFRLDPEVFAERLPDRWRMRRMLFEAAHLFPGLVVNSGRETFHAPHGLADLADLQASDEWHLNRRRPFALNVRIDDLQVVVGICGDNAPATTYRSWVNGNQTLRGHHVDGLRDALRAANLSPIVAMIHLIFQTQEFAGPTRSKLNNPHVRKPVRESLEPALIRWREQLSGTGS
jgi:DNA gyrase subunit B